MLKKISNRRSNFGKEEVDHGYAWVICGTAGLIYTITDGFSFSLGVLYPALLYTFNESASLTSWISSLLFGSMFLSGPLIGMLIKRFGARIVSFLGSLLAALGATVSFFATGVPFLILSIGVLTGFGFGCIMLSALTSTTLWFEKKRGLAFGLAIFASGVGVFAISLLTTYLLEKYELRGTLLILSGFILHAAPLSLFFKPHPPRYTAPVDDFGIIAKSKKCDLSMFRIRGYNLFVATAHLFALGYFPIFMFSAAWAEQVLLLDAPEAATFLTIISVASIAGRLFCALVLDRSWINKIFCICACVFLCGAGTALSILCHTYWSAVAFFVAYGAGGGAAIVGLSILTPTLVPIESTETASGYFVFAMGLAAMLGLPGAGAIVDLCGGDYRWLFLGCGSCMTLAAFLLLAIEMKF